MCTYNYIIYMQYIYLCFAVIYSFKICRWVINPQLEVVVPSKRTPWPKFRPPPQSNDPLHSSDAIITEQRTRSKGKVRQRVKKGSSHSP